GALTGHPPALQEFCVPLAADGFVGWRDVSEVTFGEGQSRERRRFERKGLGRGVPLSRRVSFRHRTLLHAVDGFSVFAVENEEQRILGDDGDSGDFLTVVDYVE